MKSCYFVFSFVRFVALVSYFVDDSTIRLVVIWYGNVFGPLLVDLLRYFESKLCRYIEIFCKKSKNLC